MSSQKTSWILDFVDQVSKPLVNMIKNVSKGTDAVDDMSKSVKLNEKDTKIAIEKASGYYKNLEKSIKDTEKELKMLEKVKKSGDWSEQMHAAQAFEKAQQKLERLRKDLKGAEADLKDLNQQAKRFGDQSKSWTDLATGLNQADELIDKTAQSLDFTVQFQNLKAEVKRMTDLSGGALDEFTTKSKEIGDVYDQNSNQVARAANSMTQQIGGTYMENLRLIEEGIKRGADINGDFLDSMTEYGPKIREAGLSASQGIALIAQANKKGIYADKAIDGIKEATQAIREMDKTQIDALSGIGLSTKDIEGKTSIEAIQLISKKMKGATTQAKQKILADIFKGAGEDAGVMFAEELGTMNLNLESIPAVEQAGYGIKKFFSNIGSWASEKMGNIGIHAQQFTPILQGIASGIAIMEGLSKVTWLQTIATKAQTGAQWLLNAAMTANPIGIIIVAVAALVVLIYKAVESFDTWGSSILAILGPIGLVVSAIVNLYRHWESITEAFQSGGIIAGIKRIGMVLLNVFMHPLQKILGWLGELTGLDWAKNAGKSVEKFRDSQDLISNEEKEANKKGLPLKTKQKKETGVLAPETLTFSPTAPTKLKGSKGSGSGKENSLDVGSGTNGIKSIVMNLTVNNNFSVSKDTNIRAIADKVTGLVNDRLRDSIINVG